MNQKIKNVVIATNLALLPLYRCIADHFVQLIYRLDISGFENIPDTGPALLISNHISYIDGLVIQASCKRPIRFVIDKHIYEIPLVNYFMKLDKGIPIAPNRIDVTNALDQIQKSLEQGEIVCIFPEGELTHSGMIGRFKPGVEWILTRTPVNVYPIALKGLWGSVLSRKYAKLDKGLWPDNFRMKVSSTCGEGINPTTATIDYLQKAVMDLYNKK